MATNDPADNYYCITMGGFGFAQPPIVIQGTSTSSVTAIDRLSDRNRQVLMELTKIRSGHQKQFTNPT